MIRLALAQINPVVGDISGNEKLISETIAKARSAGAGIVAFPELALTGYPPEDLLLKSHFIEANMASLNRIAQKTTDIVVIVGFVHGDNEIHNAAAVIADGAVRHVYHKQFLPNYGVFDENRYFLPGTESPVYRLDDLTFGVNICEDIWYPDGPTQRQALAGAQLIININASPFSIDKQRERKRMVGTRASDAAATVAYLNMVGGQDEVVFDGGSFIVDERGEIVVEAASFEETLLLADLDLKNVSNRRLHDPRRRKQAAAMRDVLRVELPRQSRKSGKARKPLPATAPQPELSLEESVYRALCLGLRDYVGKNGFGGCLLAVSGGVDSALVAAIAADALGPKSLHCVFMPSEFSSEESREDAGQLCANLKLRLDEIPITPVFEEFLSTLRPHFEGRAADTTEENIQARVRGTLIMALSNKFNRLVLTTGNKSEMSVGYATLYGDMAGGFAVIKDVPKMLVYALCRWRNEQGFVIPERILTKAPTAELRPGQKDTDSLPEYEVLDPILRGVVEEDRSVDEVAAATGADRAIVQRVFRMTDIAEHKRRQAPVGIKITPRAFGKDRRLPITNRFQES